MSTLLAITFDRKILLMQGFRHWKLDFKRFTTVVYMPNSDNRAQNDDHLKFAEIISQKSRLDFLVVEMASNQAFSSGFRATFFHHFNFVIFFYLYFLINFLGFIQWLIREIQVKPPLEGKPPLGEHKGGDRELLLPPSSFSFLSIENHL